MHSKQTKQARRMLVQNVVWRERRYFCGRKPNVTRVKMELVSATIECPMMDWMPRKTKPLEWIRSEEYPDCEWMSGRLERGGSRGLSQGTLYEFNTIRLDVKFCHETWEKKKEKSSVFSRRAQVSQTDTGNSCVYGCGRDRRKVRFLEWG